MGRKSSAKGQHTQDGPEEPKQGKSRFRLYGSVAVVLVGVGVLAFRGMGGGSAESAADETVVANEGPQQAPQPDAATIARAEANAKLGPRQQDILPPVPFQDYAPP